MLHAYRPEMIRRNVQSKDMHRWVEGLHQQELSVSQDRGNTHGIIPSQGRLLLDDTCI